MLENEGLSFSGDQSSRLDRIKAKSSLPISGDQLTPQITRDLLEENEELFLPKLLELVVNEAKSMEESVDKAVSSLDALLQVAYKGEAFLPGSRIDSELPSVLDTRKKCLQEYAVLVEIGLILEELIAKQETLDSTVGKNIVDLYSHSQNIHQLIIQPDNDFEMKFKELKDLLSSGS